MKKIYLSLALAAFSTLSFAQVTIADLSIAQGDTVKTEKDTTTSVTIDLAVNGSGMTWDYSGLLLHESDYVLLDDPANGLMSSLFPDADMMVNDEEDSNYIYIDKTAAHIKVIGFVELDGGDTIVRQWNMPFITFPSSLSTTASEANSMVVYQDTVMGNPDSLGGHPFVDSIRVTYVLNFNTKIDAEGVLKLPGGDFDAIRQVTWQEIEIHTEMYADSNWVFISDTMSSIYSRDSIEYDTLEYAVRFWTDDVAANFFIVSYELDSTLTTNEDRIEWLNISPTPTPVDNISEESKFISKVYPMPANESVVLSLKELEDNMTYEIVSMSGEKVKSGLLQNKLNVINVGSLKSGFYLLKVNSSSNSEYIKLSIN